MATSGLKGISPLAMPPDTFAAALTELMMVCLVSIASAAMAWPVRLSTLVIAALTARRCIIVRLLPAFSNPPNVAKPKQRLQGENGDRRLDIRLVAAGVDQARPSRHQAMAAVPMSRRAASQAGISGVWLSPSTV